MKEKQKAYVYDIENYENFFCLSACSIDDENVIQFVIDDYRNDREKIIEFFNNIWVIGYNNQRYDNIIINYILANPRVTARSINQFGGELITYQKPEYEDKFYKKFRPFLKNNKYKSLDLIRMLFSKKLRVGLKELECSLNHPNVEELPYEPGSSLTSSQKEKVLSYNINDIKATKRVLENAAEALKIRVWAHKNYKVDAFNMDGVALGMKVFERLMIDKLGSDDFTRVKKDDSPIIHVRDLLVPCIEFKTPEFQAVLDRYKKLSILKKEFDEKKIDSDFVDEDNELTSKFKWTPTISNHRFKYGIGGLHKDVLKGVWRTTDTHRVVSIDVASYYPNIIIKWKKKPSHLPEDFYEIYQLILDERLLAKSNGDTLKADTLKLSVNGFFGNTNNKYSWAYDLKSTLATTINGQLMLSMLCESCLQQGFELVDVNTDGIYVKYPREKHQVYLDMIKDWENKTKMVLEETEFKEIYFLTTADYFGVTTKINKKTGKNDTKEKGLFIDKVQLGKGMEFPVISKAVKKYFLENESYSNFIKSHDNILDFCSYKKLNRDYTCFWKGSKQQRINRFYASRCGAHLYKRKFDYKKKRYQTDHVLKDSPVLLLNNIDDIAINERCINYSFYNLKVREIIHEIEGDKNQVKMFNGD